MCYGLVLLLRTLAGCGEGKKEGKEGNELSLRIASCAGLKKWLKVVLRTIFNNILLA